MAFCSNCGKELRVGVKFCTHCGTAVAHNDNYEQPVPQGDGSESFDEASEFNGQRADEAADTEPSVNEHSDVPPGAEDIDNRPLAPTIVIAPPKKKSKNRMVRGIIKTVVGCVLVIAIIIGGVWTTAWFMSNPFRSSPVDEVDNEKYTRMLALVEDVRNPNFDEVIDDLLTKKGKAEDYSFLQEYTDKFNEILGSEYTDEEKLFCDCCYFVWYTEYQAKRYEWLSKNSGLLNSLYTGKANSYRSYADTLYDMLCSADSVTDMNNIKIYCTDHEIISDNTSEE